MWLSRELRNVYSTSQCGDLQARLQLILWELWLGPSQHGTVWAISPAPNSLFPVKLYLLIMCCVRVARVSQHSCERPTSMVGFLLPPCALETSSGLATFTNHCCWCPTSQAADSYKKCSFYLSKTINYLKTDQSSWDGSGVKALVTKPDNLSLISGSLHGTERERERNVSSILSPDWYTSCGSTTIKIKYNKSIWNNVHYN